MDRKAHWPLPRPSLRASHPEWTNALGPYAGALSRRSVPGLGLSERQIRSVLNQHNAALAKNLVWSGPIDDLLDGLLSNQVFFIPIKGLFLSETVYPDPGARPFADIDLMVPKTQLERAGGVLKGLGYNRFGSGRTRWDEQHTHHLIYVHPSAPPVELHFKLAHELACVTEFEPFFRRAEIAPLKGRSIHALAPEDHLISLLTHAASHGLRCGAYWALDVALLLEFHRDLDQAVVAKRLERRKLAPAGAAALFLAAELFPSIPRQGAELLGRLRHRVVRAAAAMLSGDRWWYHQPQDRDVRSLVTRLLMHERTDDAIATLVRKGLLNLEEAFLRLTRLL